MSSNDRKARSSLDRPTVRWAGWLLLAALAVPGASSPEVVKVRVPSSKVSAWFPAGSELQVISPEQFDEMARAAREQPDKPRPPRILRVRHSARWEEGMLAGRSEFTIEPPGGPMPGMVLLEPWSPALTGQGDGAKSARSTEEGRFAIKVAASGPRNVAMEWRQRARSGSEGRAFALSLPEIELASMVLDLPADLVPEGIAGTRVGPEPGPEPGRSHWKFEAARGRINLRVRKQSEEAGGQALWLEGPTRIDLNASPANWKAEWTIDALPGAADRLLIELDPGLELVDVSGPRVGSFRVEPDGPSSRVAIRLQGDATGPSPMTIRAICHAPAEGTWSIPSARPIDASWTGGRTNVRLDPTRVLRSTLERAGRRVAPRASDLADTSTLVFEPNGRAGPVADLTFRRPTTDATVEVRGLLRIGDDLPRIDVALTWTVERGRVLSHSADLPPGWTPDRAASVTGEPVSWHAEPLSNGGTRVHLNPPPPEDDFRSMTLTLGASARHAGVTGPLNLPRVRPAATSGRVVDEIWVATSDPGLALRPILGRGLAWIDPPEPENDDSAIPWSVEDLRNALAWRWLVDDAEARADRVRVGVEPRGEVRLDASIDEGRIRLDWTLIVDPTGGMVRTIPIHLDQPIDFATGWRSADSGGPLVEVRPLEVARRSILGFPETGSAWLLELSGPSRGRIVLRASVELPWNGSGRIPLLTLPDRFRTKGLVAIEVEPTTRLRVEESGLTSIDLSETVEGGTEATEPPPEGGRVRRRRAAMYGYRSRGCRLQAETTPGRPESVGGVVREATLTTQFFPGAGLRHRLTLRIAADTARVIELTMPRGVAVDRLRRDGQPVVTASSDRPFRVAIPAPGPGRSACTVTLDYRTIDPKTGRIEPSSILPDCSMPCLSITWEVVAPQPWVLGEITSGLIATDPPSEPSWTKRFLGFESSNWTRAARKSSEAEKEAILAELDQSLAGEPAGETTLGDWLLKLDAGQWPLVVDRMALLSSGWGPGSRLNSAKPEARPSAWASGVLQSMGLTAVPVGGAILITTRADAPDRPGVSEVPPSSWTAAIQQAAETGSDPTDRFQSAARWRDEPTPHALSATEAPERPPGPVGWKVWRMTATSWPTTGTSIRMVDERSETLWGWLIAAVVLVAGAWARDRSPKVRAAGLSAVWVAATIAIAWTWPNPTSTATGLVRGCLALLAFWLGRSLHLAAALRSSEIGPPSPTRRSGIWARSSTATLALAVIGLAAMPSAAGPGRDAPILALLPFDGPPDPSARSDRVVMLLGDYERLKKLASPEPPPALVVVSLVGAEHHVSREEPGQAVVESRYEVELEGESPATWTLPVGPARELSATLDGQPMPLAIAPDGLSASVPIAGAGIHSLRFRRAVPLIAAGPGSERFRLPINRAACAFVSVDRNRQALGVEIPNAAGRVEDRDGGISGELGPADAIEVRWLPEARPRAIGFRGPVETTFLWDARPTGDLIRLRLMHSETDGVSTIRIATEPGLVVRGFSIPDLVGIRREGTIESPEWVAHIDPPLPRDVAIAVDFWRPAQPGEGDRRLPRIEVLGAGRLVGTLGFRRPSDWSGRLEAGRGSEPLVEANFVRAWGELPADGLTLAGAVRFARPPDLVVVIGPVPLRRSVRPRMTVSLEPGRLSAMIEANLSDRQGRSFDLEMGIPANFRIVRVQSAGLVDWQRVGRDRLRLQFDGSEVPGRLARIQGFIPVQATSVMTETRNFQARIPWPRWFDAEAEPGLLALSCPIRFQMDAGEGVSTLAPIGIKDQESVFRSSYRVDRPVGLGPVTWSSPRSKVDVTVQSDLTIESETVTWTAVIVCDVSGGLAESIQWNLPTAWATGATLEIDDHSHRLVSEPRGSKGETTLWRISPDPPIWGRTRLVLRSRLPLITGVPFPYPEISPLALPGRGSVERYDLAIANISGRPLEVSGSPGLQAIDASQFRSDASPSPPGSIDHAYHVTGDRWSLQLQVSRGAGDGRPATAEGKPALVSLARLSTGLGPLGQAWGSARFDLNPRPGPFLPFRMPEGVILPWATVDGSVVPVLRDGSGRWRVPLGDRAARRVELTWLAPGPDRGQRGASVVEWPELDQGTVPTMIRVEAPPSIEVKGSGGLSREEWEVENAEHLARRVVSALSDFDRSSQRDRDEVLQDLIEFELGERDLRRSATGTNRTSGPKEERLDLARASMNEAAQLAGLEDLLQTARARVSPSPTTTESSGDSGDLPTGLLRVRRIGESHFFRGAAPVGGGTSPISWAEKPDVPRWKQAAPWSIACVGLATAFGAVLIVVLPVRPVRLATVVGVGLGTVLIFALEPIGTVSALAIAGMGWRWPDGVR